MAIAYIQSNQIANKEFGNTAYSVDATQYIGLSTTVIANDGTGATEPTGGAYARVGVANNKTTWGAAVNGALSNLIQIDFPESTASWGTITYLFIADALTGGNVKYFQALTNARTVESGTIVYFPAGYITVSIVNS